MTTATVEEVQTNLPSIISALKPGEDVVIMQHNRPVARLVAEPRQRKLGGGIGKLEIVQDDESYLEDFKEYMP
jgi:antitoxin (DNA-binding transcriptional repressor) of toxin-antitoxin stability system